MTQFRTFSIYDSYVDDKGYVRVNVGRYGDHPHANRGHVYAHRLVMEAHLGRYLDPSEVVHHINEVKTDNRLQNLYLCSAEEHVQIHNRGRHNSLAKRARIARGVQEFNKRKNKKPKGAKGV